MPAGHIQKLCARVYYRLTECDKEETILVINSSVFFLQERSLLTDGIPAHRMYIFSRNVCNEI
jgi:hypothetical protein